MIYPLQINKTYQSLNLLKQPPSILQGSPSTESNRIFSPDILSKNISYKDSLDDITNLNKTKNKVKVLPTIREDKLDLHVNDSSDFGQINEILQLRVKLLSNKQILLDINNQMRNIEKLDAVSSENMSKLVMHNMRLKYKLKRKQQKKEQNE